MVSSSDDGRVLWWVMTWRPVLTLLVLAPFMGETLSTATAPLDLVLPWNFVLFVALYGGGALLCREGAHRWGGGVTGLALLGAAYGIYEEALVDRFWFDPGYARDTGVGDYARVGDTSLLLATHLTAFHAAVSVCSSVLIVEWLFPRDRLHRWARPRVLAVAAVGMLGALFVTYEEFVRPPLGPALAATVLAALLVAAAWLVGRRAPSTDRPSRGRPRPRLLGVVAFLATGSHFVLVYAVPSTGLAWPVGLALTLTPLVAGLVLIRSLSTTGAHGPDGLWVVTGIVGFFLLLDLVVGLGGRYDLSVAAASAMAGLGWLHRRVAATVQREG